MKFSDTLRGLLRRWYIVFPGILLAAAAAAGAWYVISPGYERSATQLLLPGADSLPEGANPYLFLGGLVPAADVLVRAIGSENVLNEVVEEHPGVEIEITRDITTAGPVILIVVTAGSDAAAEEVLGLLVERTETTLEQLQKVESIAVENRVTVLPLTVDTQSVPQQRTRMLATAGAGLGGVVLTLLLAGLVDGLSTHRRRHATPPRDEPTDVTPTDIAPADVATNRDELTPVAPTAGVPTADAPKATDPTSAARHHPRRPRPPVASQPPPALFDQSRYEDEQAAAEQLNNAR
ncbi:hypothetical protein [Salinibacterium sp. ZJ454]|uniref:hypothetical protein n=1 Tax=Salinibacterium sp. ZJ454 TaxID=2708339 RepID=UPI00141E2D81|nr:hypothetical protein [Salinibacterium sp. ZJ454]